MKKVVLTFGLLSGAVVTGLMFMTLPFAERIGFDRAVYVGYTTILISMLFVYFGVRSYRDNVLGGQMSFGTGFTAGLLITLVSSACYVASWLVMYYGFMDGFGERYAAYIVESAQARGASQAEIDVALQQGRDAIAMLDNPLINAAVSFTEPIPVGLLVTLISATALRTKAPKAPAPEAP
ncbi:MAG TPA: DUF4199 domain-containing protein [Vicinamibacterales bacterium]|nr:DUF4199 domain-containing protein [Vicinamibacterales bacterium]